MGVLNTNIAKLNIRISHEYAYIERICRRYLSGIDAAEFDNSIDIDVSVSEEDLNAEKPLLSAANGSGPHPAMVEAMAIFRKIAEALPDFDCFLMHGSAVAVDGQGYMFTAPSGTGKSTHVSLWRELFGERAVMVNDDKPFIRLSDDGIYVCGSPWNGKHGLGENICVPLKAICFLNRGEKNSIVPVTPHDAFPSLLRQIYRPADPAALEKTIRLIDRVSTETGLYKLYCNMEPEAAAISYAGMNG